MPLFRLALTSLLLVLLPSCGKKTLRQQPLEGRVTFLDGDCQILRPGQGKWQPLAISDAVEFGDSLETGPESQAEITFDGDNHFRLAESTRVAVSSIRGKNGGDTLEVYTSHGTLISNIKKIFASRSQYRVRTPTAVAAIRGTFFSVAFSIHTRTTHVNVVAGRVWARNPGQGRAVIVQPGCYTMIAFGAVPIRPAKFNYGQWKKMERWMAPALFKEYGGKLKFKKVDSPFDGPGKGPKIQGPDKGGRAGSGGHHLGKSGKFFKPGGGGPKGGGREKNDSPKGGGGGPSGKGGKKGGRGGGGKGGRK